MATTPQDVRNIAREFRDTGAFPDPVIAGFITDAAVHVNAASWGDSYDNAIKYMAAHLMALSNPAVSAKPVRVYETPGAADIGMLGQTTYGQHFASMRSELLLGVLVP